MKKLGDRILLSAIAISLAIHLVVAVLVHNVPTVARDESDPPTIRIDIERTPEPSPPPTPTPPPTRRIVPAVQPPVAPVRVQPPATHPNTTSTQPKPAVLPPQPYPVSDPTGSAIGSPEPPATVEPTYEPTPACERPDVAARATETMTAQAPPGAEGVTGEAQVEVTLDLSGAVSSVKIYRSSGNQLLDNAAVRAASESHYAAQIRNCQSVGGSYLFTVDFD